MSQFIGQADTVLADSISGIIEKFENVNPVEKRIEQHQHQTFDDFHPSEQEYYSYSELPRAYQNK